MNAPAPSEATPPARQASGGVRLARGGPLSLARGRCLSSRYRASACSACFGACPVGALRRSAAGIELAAGCTGCGRCAAACPVGALVADGFEHAAVPAPGARAGTGALVLDCARGDGSPADVRLPCLGGLGPADLLRVCVEAQDRPVVLVDRGACAACDSGGPLHPAAAVVEQVSGWMRIAGVPEGLLPRIAREHRTGAARNAGADDPLQSRGRARRGFLAALADPAAARSAPAAQPAPREAILAALEALAARHGGAVAPGLFHHLEASAACQGLRVCAATCPTGALVRYRSDAAGFAGIAFDARDCLGCGHCAAVCPNQALTLRPGPGPGAGRRPLTSFVQRECADCGARFAVRAGEAATRCERCRQRAQLARSAFATLFPPRPPLQAWSHPEEPR